MKVPSVYEFRNREIKVARLLAEVPLADTAEVREALAVAIETSADWRAKLVSVSGVTKPSEETWRQLVASVRLRPLSSVAEIRERASLWEDPFRRCGENR